MSDDLIWRWQCQTQGCRQIFSTEADLAKHIETYSSRVQELILELQRALAHSGPNAPESGLKISDNDGNNEGGLYCPHSDCRHKKPYTELRSLQRHFPTHVCCNIDCPTCGGKFKNVRKYETHLPRCLRQGPADKKADAKKSGKTWHKFALNELERELSTKAVRRDTVAQEAQTIPIGVCETADPQLAAEPGDAMDVATGLQNPDLQSFQPGPDYSPESCQVQPSTLTRNDTNFEFATPYAADNSPILHRHVRGPVLMSNPMEWSHALPTQPLYMTTPGAGVSLLCSQTGMSRPSSAQVDGSLEDLYGVQ
ncbi:hypothetical protein F5883DRAFT_263884 [Diaporthe sp. PMI_573]|nr:hypothetical protein F5883DRAFT_263884 [Diaporthaceae sp. PMI_573]